MLESERQVRQFNFFDRIVRILQSECCVADWEQEESFDFIYEGGGSGGGTGDTYSKAEIDGMMSRKADKTELSAYVTTATLNNKLNGYVKTADLVNYVTTTTLNQTLSTYAKVSDLSNYVSIDMLTNYATITYVDEKIGAIGSVLDAINRRVI